MVLRKKLTPKQKKGIKQISRNVSTKLPRTKKGRVVGVFKFNNPARVTKELMKFRSFRESTPRTREDKLTRAIQRRERKRGIR